MTYLVQHTPVTYANQMAFLPQQTLQTLTPSARPSLGDLLSQLQTVSQSNNIHTSKLCLMYVREQFRGKDLISSETLLFPPYSSFYCNNKLQDLLLLRYMLHHHYHHHHHQHLFHNNINRPLLIIIRIRFLLAGSKFFNHHQTQIISPTIQWWCILSKRYDEILWINNILVFNHCIKSAAMCCSW